VNRETPVLYFFVLRTRIARATEMSRTPEARVPVVRVACGFVGFKSTAFDCESARANPANPELINRRAPGLRVARSSLKVNHDWRPTLSLRSCVSHCSALSQQG
jgi:hypothetical protein